MEWMKAFQTIRQVLPGRKVRVVADDRKLWRKAQECGLEFTSEQPASEIFKLWNERLQRWEDEELQSLSQVMAGRHPFGLSSTTPEGRYRQG